MKDDELRAALSVWPGDEVRQALDELQESSQAQIIERYGVKFWSAGESYFPEQ